MTPTFYDSPPHLAAFSAACARARGTPFRPNSEAPGPDGGFDCVHLLNWVHRTCGAIGRVEIPRQTMDHGHHSDRSLLLEAFDTWPGLRERFTRLPAADCSPENFLPGDVLCFTQGRVPHHGALWIGCGCVLHALRPAGVYEHHLAALVRGQRLFGHLAAAYRPLPWPPSSASS